MSVVLDFPANIPASRAWMRSSFEAADCGHKLHQPLRRPLARGGFRHHRSSPV